MAGPNDPCSQAILEVLNSPDFVNSDAGVMGEGIGVGQQHFYYHVPHNATTPQARRCRSL